MPPLVPASAIDFSYGIAAHFVRGQWGGPVGDQELRAHYTKLLGLAQAAGGSRFWLLDLRGHPRHLPEFERWFDTTFAETARATLGGPLYIAYVLDAAHRALLTARSAPPQLRACIRHEVYINVFESKATALVWLAQRRAHDPDNGCPKLAK